MTMFFLTILQLCKSLVSGTLFALYYSLYFLLGIHMKNIFISILLILSFLSLIADSFSAVDSLAEQAVTSHPEAENLKIDIEALEQSISASRVIMDPMIAVEYSSMPIDAPFPGEHAMSGIQFKLQQQIPYPGKNDKREAVAKQSKIIKETEIIEWENQLKAKVKQAYWNLTAVRILKKIDLEHAGLIDKLILTVKARYESGGSSQYNLLRLSVMKENLLDEIDDYSRKERILAAAINSALNRAYTIFAFAERALYLKKDS